MLKFVRMIAVTLATVCFGMSAHAATATVDDAKAYAHQVGDKVIAILDDKALNDDSKIQKLEALFTDVVDVKWIGRFVLGTAWRSATPEQQEAYLDAYGKFLVKNYTSNFAEYGGETFVVTTARAEDRAGEFFVRTEIQRKGGQPNVIVDYRLRAEDGKKVDFKVFDIIVEGVSLIATQRSEFASVVNRQGLDKLISALKAKTDKLNDQMRKDMANNKKGGAKGAADSQQVGESIGDAAVSSAIAE
ncbi:MAG: ABC transporter substrate-binding protein [Alphaproteobacteria bacterium]|nr:ABC transporter substrate-binding protein [Alphaproteobacteria bacterium]